MRTNAELHKATLYYFKCNKGMQSSTDTKTHHSVGSTEKIKVEIYIQTYWDIQLSEISHAK